MSPSFKLAASLALLYLTSWVAAVPLARAPQINKRQNYPGWNYDSDKVRGVNIGGWLVLEPYITPSLFEAFGSDESQIPVDEYHYTQYLGKDEASNRLNQHWSTFYTEQDFYDIASYGLNHVRIPIGYWAYIQFDDDPYVFGADIYLEQAIGWARNAGLKVWIDLHGAPGSQNGFDNSGLRDSINWQNGNNVDITLSVLNIISQKYGTEDYSDVVVGIELLNEPLGPSLDMSRVKDFYLQGYDVVRNSSHERAVIFHDAFQALNYWNGDDFMRLPDYYFSILDHHQYQVFSPGEVSRSIDEHVSVACGIGSSMQSEYHWRVTGEWSGALTDCAKWLNGVGRGARYDGSYNNNGQTSYWVGSCDCRQDITTWSDQAKADTRKYIEAQLEAYDQGAGWIFWCYKTETTLEWDFKRLVDGGLFPYPFDQRQYPNVCGFY